MLHLVKKCSPRVFWCHFEYEIILYYFSVPAHQKDFENSGVLRPESTKIVILVLNENLSLDYFQIQHLDITLSKEFAKIIKF